MKLGKPSPAGEPMTRKRRKDERKEGPVRGSRPAGGKVCHSSFSRKSFTALRDFYRSLYQPGRLGMSSKEEGCTSVCVCVGVRVSVCAYPAHNTCTHVYMNYMQISLGCI